MAFIPHNTYLIVLAPLIIFSSILYLMRTEFITYLNFAEIIKSKGSAWNTFIAIVVSQAICNIVMSQLFTNPDPLSMKLMYLPIMPVYMIFAPIVEELVFRRLIFGELSKRYGFIVSSVVSSLVFAAGHMTVTGSIGYFVTGMILCWSYRKYGFVTVVLAHTCLNLSVVIVSSLKM
jgi:membrane protease YdiL (CAAX protease family)